MRVHIYAEETEPAILDQRPPGRIVEREKNGVHYVGLELGDVVFWFTSMSNLRKFSTGILEMLP